MPVSTPPAFKPAVAPIPLSTAGFVLTSNGPTSQPTFQAAGGGGAAALGARLAYASPAGGAVAAAPAGFSGSTGRLIVTLPSGSATWVSLTGETDGQLLVVINNDGANTLTLPAAHFPGVGDLVLNPGNRALLYYDATDLVWERTSP